MSPLKPEVGSVGVAANGQQLQVRQSDPRHLTTGTSVLCNLQRYKPREMVRWSDGHFTVETAGSDSVQIYHFVTFVLPGETEIDTQCGVCGLISQYRD